MAKAENPDDVLDGKQQGAGRSNVKIADPLFFWVMVLVLALIVRIVLFDTSTFTAGSQAYMVINELSSFFLLGAGSLILPLVVGAAIGAEVGSMATSARSALTAGIINGVYAAIVYVIAIIIIYEIIIYMIPQAQITPEFLVTFLILPQVAVLIGLVEVFAVLSHIRKVNG